MQMHLSPLEKYKKIKMKNKMNNKMKNKMKNNLT